MAPEKDPLSREGFQASSGLNGLHGAEELTRPTASGETKDKNNQLAADQLTQQLIQKEKRGSGRHHARGVAANRLIWSIPPGIPCFRHLPIDGETCSAEEKSGPEEPRLWPALDAVPSKLQVITGYRAWRVAYVGKEIRLSALSMEVVWEPRQKTAAKCYPFNGAQLSEHEAPDFCCLCGIWAFKSFEYIERLLPILDPDSGYGPGGVLGKVSLWGRVIETEFGYRAQYAYPAKLCAPGALAEELRLVYGVPVKAADC